MSKILNIVCSIILFANVYISCDNTVALNELSYQLQLLNKRILQENLSRARDNLNVLKDRLAANRREYNKLHIQRGNLNEERKKILEKFLHLAAAQSSAKSKISADPYLPVQGLI